MSSRDLQESTACSNPVCMRKQELFANEGTVLRASSKSGSLLKHTPKLPKLPVATHVYRQDIYPTETIWHHICSMGVVQGGIGQLGISSACYS